MTTELLDQLAQASAEAGRLITGVSDDRRRVRDP